MSRAQACRRARIRRHTQPGAAHDLSTGNVRGRALAPGHIMKSDFPRHALAAAFLLTPCIGAAQTAAPSPTPAASSSASSASRSEDHTSELQSLMRIQYAVFYLKTTPT